MRPSENATSHSQCVVDFNPDLAWTLTYDDALGRLIFVFECGEKPKSVRLDRSPIENHQILVVRDEAMRARVDLALERTKTFLVSCGYEVEVH